MAREIVSVSLTFGGFHGGTERRRVFFDGEEIRTEREFYNGACDRGEFLFDGVTRDVFLARFDALHIEEWDRAYNNENIDDGTQWDLEIEDSDGKSEEYWGSNAYPANFRELLKLMEMIDEE